jgi:hypothetical protein
VGLDCGADGRGHGEKGCEGGVGVDRIGGGGGVDLFFSGTRNGVFSGCGRGLLVLGAGLNHEIGLGRGRGHDEDVREIPARFGSRRASVDARLARV